MLLLAGLLGMLAVGSIVMMDPATNADDPDDAPPEGERSGDEQTSVQQFSEQTTTALEDLTEEIDATVDTATQVIPTPDLPVPNLLTFIDENGVAQTLENLATDGGDLLVGSSGPDVLDGGAGADNILSGAGDDTISGGADDDALLGEAGNDSLSGDEGNDQASGGAGNDTLSGGEGNDTLSGNEGDDEILGDAGNDDLWGATGHDVLSGGEGNDVLRGNEGNDTLVGGAGTDTLNGGAGDDLLNGVHEDPSDGSDRDYLNGGEGDDTIYTGSADQVTGGVGSDVFMTHADVAGPPPQIWDFTSGEDALVVMYATGDPIPSITIAADPAASNQWLVAADGLPVASVFGQAPVPSDISVIPQGT